ncbi:MAG: hypothetical protein GVY16_11090 [Planctomycetes bacterium]|nr:zf-TFIIB domain-containing protein [Phycisphaerae bacterium]NBB96268.1 hypothetical protein [Planctomycetota bacterium]
MNCPACQNEMTPVTISEVTVDVCKDGCGGMWFDNFELQKFDEVHESAGDELLKLAGAPKVTVDTSQKRPCPTCEGVTMMQHFFSVKREIAIDECPGCGGIFLDAGELAAIHEKYPTEEARNAEAQKVLGKEIQPALEKMHAENKAGRRRASRFANALRFICPTHYIPGKQRWGAF